MKQFYTILLSLLMAGSVPTHAQLLMETLEDTYLNTGGRIFSHRMSFAGIVSFQGEDIRRKER